MKILGLNVQFSDNKARGHDATAAVLVDGKIEMMCEEERPTRVKESWFLLPTHSARICLQSLQLDPQDLDFVAVGWNVSSAPLDVMALMRELFPRAEGNFPTVVCIPHHLAHAASGFYSSKFREAAILVVDGRGETEATSFGVGHGSSIRLLRSFPWNCSLGWFYEGLSEFCRLGRHNAGKTMGLAAYGRVDGPRIDAFGVSGDGYVLRRSVPAIDDIAVFRLTSEGQTHIIPGPGERGRAIWWAHELMRQFPEAKRYTDVMDFRDIARAGQRVLEDILLHLVELVIRASGHKDLVLTGGVGLNCTANGRILESGLVREMFVPPYSSDVGVAVGAAQLLYACETGQRPEPLPHAYIGPGFDEEEINRSIREESVQSTRLHPDEVPEVAAKLIHQGAVIGWFQGRAEVGPRALGARSILGSARLTHNHRRINDLKGRERWRPLAPSILSEDYESVISSNYRSPFMLFAQHVREDAVKQFPVITHVDGSARPQSVSHESNPQFAKLLRELRRLEGTGIVVNTSFNTRNEPIVHSPLDAIRSFRRAGLDSLLVENWLITR